MINLVALQGRLTRDPELRTTDSGVSVCSFSVAVDVGWGGKKTAHFIDCVAWRQTAEFLCKYFQKGALVALDGFLQTREWFDKNGAKRKATEVVVNNVHFCGGKRDAGRAENHSQESGGEELWEEMDDLPFE